MLDDRTVIIVLYWLGPYLTRYREGYDSKKSRVIFFYVERYRNMDSRHICPFNVQ